MLRKPELRAIQCLDLESQMFISVETLNGLPGPGCSKNIKRLNPERVPYNMILIYI
jgi:hypothetical protein